MNTARKAFPGTEVDYAVEVCNAVLDIWKPSPDRKVIINIPTTVQIAMPHVFATQIEYIHKNLKYRDSVLISVHPHNEQRMRISDAEMGVLAGADGWRARSLETEREPVMWIWSQLQ